MAGAEPGPPPVAAATESATASESKARGRRLVDDGQLPAWLHRLVAGVDGAQMPGQLGELARNPPPGARHGSVLMLFGDGPRGPDLLLTERAHTMRSHAGQPAFPGGANDPGEDAITAALREGQEETGLDPASVLPVALFPELYLPPSGFLVRPVLGYWHEPGEVGPVDPAETASVARVPVADLADPRNRGQVQHSSGFIGPAFHVADLVVWGFTAGLIDVLLDLGGWSAHWEPGRIFDLPDLP